MSRRPLNLRPRNPEHERLMALALEEGRKAGRAGDVPIGALVLDARGQILGRGYNRREADGDPTAHAELLAIRQAAEALGSWRLEGTSLVVTVEPCLMCAGAILLARIPQLIMGAWEPKTGAVGSVYDVLRDRRVNHSVEVYSEVLADECSQLMRDFFKDFR